MIRKAAEATGINKILEATLAYIPQLFILAILGVSIVIANLWIDIHDLQIDVAEAKEKLTATRLCEHILLCTAASTNECKNSVNRVAATLDNHLNSAETWKTRLINVEDKLYYLKGSSDALSSIETRVEFLEKKIRK